MPWKRSSAWRTAVLGPKFSWWTTIVAMAWRRETPHRASRNLDADALRDAGRRFLSGEKVAELLAQAPRSGPVPALVEARVERELSAVLGAALSPDA